VSVGTVSNVLNAPHLVSVETRSRVLEAIEALGYRPNRAARSLQAKKTYLIGYRLPDPGFSAALDVFLHQLVRTAAEHGFDVAVFAPRRGQDDLSAYREVIRAGNVDGFILSETNYADPRVEMLSELSVPFVTFGRANHPNPFPWVDVDGGAGVTQVVRHLADRGHRRIALIAWPEGSESGDTRVEGFHQGMAATGLPVDSDLVVRCESGFAAGRLAAGPLLDDADPPTAIVTVQDELALGVMSAATNRGIRVGDKLAVAGFDDIPAASLAWPGLTSVRQPFDDVARKLVDLLVARLTLPDEQPDNIMLSPQLMVRASTTGSSP
ncbi:MAG: LacI family DNA-binding transcriptional regulator, partial [Acidimicrobiia bacterium]|nr:LacI family DNA-binding transcriptional regulator [Acidimicrobiia bacterium]